MMITTVKLPVIQGTTSVKDAIEQMKASGTSGLVAVDDGRRIVVDDQMLRNTRIIRGDQTPVSVAAQASLPPAPAQTFTFLRQAAGQQRPQQPGFAVLDIVDDVATVKTDPRRAEVLSQPTALFDKTQS